MIELVKDNDGQWITPKVPSRWNYDESVKKVQKLIYKWKSITVEMLEELYIARSFLDGRKNNYGNQHANGTKVPLATWTNYCETIGHSRQVVNRWLIGYDHETKTIAHVGHNSGDNEWYTPQEIIDSVYEVMGRIDLDPASSNVANEMVRAKRFYDIERNGLSKKWRGSVWMNPPYSQPEIEEFTDKLVKDFCLGHISQAIVLTNNATETQWCQTLAKECSAICLISSRVKFWAIDKIASPLQGQILTYFGKNTQKFLRTFEKHGEVFRK